MKVYFNNLGVVRATDFTGDSLRQGSVGVELKAYFDGVDNALYTATLNYTRHDGGAVSGLIMSLGSTNNELYTYKFNDPWFFAKAGSTTLTIYLRDSGGNVIAQGQVTFSIEATDYDGDPTITVSQYNSLLAAIGGLATGDKAILTYALLPEATDYEDGQVIYVKSSSSFYQLESGAWVLKFNCTNYYTKSEIDGFITPLINSINEKSSVSGTVDETQHWRTLTINGVTHNIGGSGGGSSYIAGTGIVVNNILDTISIDDTVVATKSFVSETYETQQHASETYVSKTQVGTSSALGLVKSSTTGTTANRDYNVEVNNDGTMKVNVPWTDTTYSAGNNIAISAQNAISVSSGNAASGKVMTSDGQGGASFLDAPKELPTPTSADSGKVVKVKSDGSGFEFGQFQGLTNPMISSGDMITGGANGAPVRLAKPSEYPVSLMLTSQLGAPQWFRRHKGGSETSYDSNNEITISNSTTSLGPSDAYSARRLIFVLRNGKSEIYSPFMIVEPYFSLSQDGSNPTKMMAYPADQQKRIEFNIWRDTINSLFKIKIYEIDYQGNRSLYNMSGSTLYWDSYYE